MRNEVYDSWNTLAKKRIGIEEGEEATNKQPYQNY